MMTWHECHWMRPCFSVKSQSLCFLLHVSGVFQFHCNLVPLAVLGKAQKGAANDEGFTRLLQRWVALGALVRA